MMPELSWKSLPTPCFSTSCGWTGRNKKPACGHKKRRSLSIQRGVQIYGTYNIYNMNVNIGNMTVTYIYIYR